MACILVETDESDMSDRRQDCVRIDLGNTSGHPLQEPSYKKRLLAAGRDLIENTGRISVENLQEMWAELEETRAK
jgi:hypothetical protein